MGQITLIMYKLYLNTLTRQEFEKFSYNSSTKMLLIYVIDVMGLSSKLVLLSFWKSYIIKNNVKCVQELIV